MNRKSISIFTALAAVVAAMAGATSSVAGTTTFAKGQRDTHVFLGGIPVDSMAATGGATTEALVAFDQDAVARHLPPIRRHSGKLDPIQTAAIANGVFRSVAIPMKNFPVTGRWAPVYRAIKGCVGNACGRNSGVFADIVASARQGGFIEKLNKVNRGVNRMIAYKRDSALHGKLDYWAKPDEILRRGAGDCEDFAILKMAALADAGVPTRSMSLVVLQDREKNVFHAILSVATGSGNFILDNVRNTVVRDTALPSYVPLYSFSTDRAWIHGVREGEEKVASASGGLDAVAPGEGPLE